MSESHYSRQRYSNDFTDSQTSESTPLTDHTHFHQHAEDAFLQDEEYVGSPMLEPYADNAEPSFGQVAGLPDPFTSPDTLPSQVAPEFDLRSLEGFMPTAVNEPPWPSRASSLQAMAEYRVPAGQGASETTSESE